MTDEINDQILEAIFKLGRTFKESMHEDFEHSHLTMLQCQALEFTKKHASLHMGDIANHFSTTMPTATVLIDKLIAAKLVKRQNDKEDRRIVKISITKYGDKLFTAIKKKRSDKMKELLAYLSKKDKVELLRILTLLAEKSENL